jgi:hypothetical protein
MLVLKIAVEMFIRRHYGSWSLVQGEAGKCAASGKKMRVLVLRFTFNEYRYTCMMENKFFGSLK